MTVASARRRRSLMVRPADPSGRPCRPGSRTPASADLGARDSSATQPGPFRIDEAGRADLDPYVRAAHRVMDAQLLADPLAAAAQQAEPDRAVERGREGDRGHMALVILGARLGAEREEMR